MTRNHLDELIRDLHRPFSRRAKSAEQALVEAGDAAVEPVAALLFADAADHAVQNAGARILEGIGTPAVVPHLLRAVTSSQHASSAAARILARRGGAEPWRALLDVARSGPRFPAAAALRALGEHADASIVPELLELVRTRADEAREEAVEAASRLGGASAFEAVVPLLADPDFGTRWTAAGCLARMPHPQAAARLAGALEQEENRILRRRLAECLLERKDPAFLPIVLAGLSRFDGDTGSLHEALALVGGGRAAEFAPYLSRPEANVRIAAAIALGVSADAAAAEPLLAARRDADSGVRRQVRVALQQLRRAGIPVDLPPASLRDRAAGVAESLLHFFGTPSTEGFSAYRTGWVAHFAFSTLLAAAAAAGAGPLGFGAPAAAGLALATVVLLWPSGVRVGVSSHYNPLLMLAALAVLAGTIALGAALRQPALLLAPPIAVAAHALMSVLSLLLRGLARALR